MTWDSIVIGAGCAGLAAATRLAECGRRVLVLERRPILGGRASSFEDPTSSEVLDNGQHLFLGAYTETQNYLRRIGSEPELRFFDQLEIPLLGPDGKGGRLRAARVAAPFHLLLAILRFGALSWRDRLGTLRLALAARGDVSSLGGITVTEWLNRTGQSAKAKDRLWVPLTLATLNADPDVVPASLLAVVLREGFLRSAEASRVALSTVGLSNLLGAPAGVYLSTRGGEVRTRQLVRGLLIENGRVTGVKMQDGTEERARSVIAAIPPPALRDLVKDSMPQLEEFVASSDALKPSPILSVHAWLSEEVFTEPFVGFWGTTYHWAFRKKAFSSDGKSRHFSLVISAADVAWKKTKAELTDLAQEELRRCFRRPSLTVERAVVVRESEATWVPPLGANHARLPIETPVANFALGGDWTDTGLPCTIEGAVLSGHRAAEMILRVQPIEAPTLTNATPLATVRRDEAMDTSFPNAGEILGSLKGTIEIDGEEIVVSDLKKFKEKDLDELVYRAVFHPDSETRTFLCWLIRAIGLSVGVIPASIEGYYRYKGQGKDAKKTVPAINIRGFTYDVSRALIRAALNHSSRALICEIARSEIGYTAQRPQEYVAVLIAAAIREGFSGPLFIQGDHFQFNAKRFAQDPARETEDLKNLVREAIEAGFFNIDIDASTLVDLSAATLEDQQKLNIEKTVEMVRFIREIQPKGVSVSIGGEIGEVGGKNSTPDELRVFLDGMVRGLETPDESIPGLSKVSVQTGTTHGGIPLETGGVAPVQIAFDVLKTLSALARDAYKLAGAVQHGASTLPESEFEKFSHADTAEIHLATAFQNLIYDGGHFPKPLYSEIAEYLHRECAGEKDPSQTEAQFLYKTRKKAFGPFKKKMWDLPEKVRESIGKDLQVRFELILRKLNVTGTLDEVVECVDAVKVNQPLPSKFENLFR